MTGEKVEKIYKYQLVEGSVTGIWLPPEAKALHVAEQNGMLTLWVQVPQDIDSHPTNRNFHAIPTGFMDVPENSSHVGTVVMVSGMVWHIYEEEND